MVFCKMIFKGDGFTRPLVSEHKYFLQKTIIYCPWIKSFVSKQPVRCLESSLELPSQLPWGGCLYKVWRPARPGMLHFYLLCVCVWNWALSQDLVEAWLKIIWKPLEHSEYFRYSHSIFFLINRMFSLSLLLKLESFVTLAFYL